MREADLSQTSAPGASRDPLREARGHVNQIRTKLQMLGFTDEPLGDLQRLLCSPSEFRRAFAARELALWAMRERTPQGCAEARRYLAQAVAADVADMRDRLAVLDILACHGLGLGPEAVAGFAADVLARGQPDALLALANLTAETGGRIGIINRVLAGFGIAPVTLRDGPGSAYDRLTVRVALSRVPADQGPLVTVLVAAWNAAATLPTALRALREQTWGNLQILVLDDASSDDSAAVALQHATADQRIEVIRMPRNVGAYGARNHGLDLARGTYVTLLDADDWAHPSRIEAQVRYLEQHPAVVGCLTEQARATDDLEFTRWLAGGRLIVPNTASLMFRRAPVRAALGYWDTVRFGADAELIRRIGCHWGEAAVAQIDSGPLAFLRAGAGSMVADDATGMDGFYYGARKEYFDAQTDFHRRATAAGADGLRYHGDPARRPFAVPRILQERPSLTPLRRFDTVHAGDFRVADADLARVLGAVRASRARGVPVALFEAYDYGLKARGATAIDAELRAEIDGEMVQMLVFGETAACRHLAMTRPGLGGRYWPKILVEA